MIKNRIIVLLVLSIVFLTSCSTVGPFTGKNIPGPGDLDVKYIPIQPRDCPSITQRTPQGEKEIFFSTLNNEDINKLLPLEQSVVTVQRITAEGGISFASAKWTAEAGHYQIFLDYLKFRDETIVDNNIPCRVGVGIRIIADIVTKKSNLDLGSIFSLGFAAKQGYLSGQIEVLKIGIDSPKISFLMPPPTDINDSALQNALQSAIAIRTQIYEPGTTLTPHIVAIKKIMPSSSAAPDGTH